MKHIFLEDILATTQVDRWAEKYGHTIIRAVPKFKDKPKGFVVYYI